MKCQVLVREHPGDAVGRVDTISDQVPLRCRVVVIEGVGPLRFSEGIVHVVQQVEAVHVVELRRIVLIEKLLLVSVKVLAVVHYGLPVGCPDEPLVVGFEVGHIEGVKGRVNRGQLLQFDG